MRLLLVEDDHLLGSGLQIGLQQEGYRAEWVRDAGAAAHALRLEPFDAVVLDLGLPDRDGMTLLREIRHQQLDVPVLIVTARDGLDDRVGGLDAGADDYLIKPFDLSELAARLRALVRRSGGHASAALRAGNLTLNTHHREALLDGLPLALSPKEFALLEMLAAQRDHVVARSRLQNSLSDWGEPVESNALEVHIHNLRRKLGRTRIETVRGVGYKLVSEPAP
ncbi:MAG: response regulator [Thiohalocapsa sp.]|uniref:response regulator n=1 Tax=Thiohalocapsa sp. TaxID=2497641 RepID=UPI0025FA33AE|nr:response regulator [Thiohalocapsa sp.]MCG6940470.1 response regulator [Thiohalocapsa sp.]